MMHAEHSQADETSDIELSPALLAAAQELSLATVASPGLYGRGLRSQMSIFDDPKDDVSRKKTA